jgi:aminoglycoside phosphotransferase (APT) family kinase protein
MIEVDESVVRKVLATLGWPKPRQLRRLRGGVVNPAYCVNEEAIIRFNSRDLDQQKFLREKLCYDLAPLSELAPRVLHYLDRHPNFDSEILVTEKLPGRRISDDWPRMEPELQKALAHEAAQALARLHETRFEKFGSLENPARQFANWEEAVESDLERALKLSFKTKVLSHDLEGEVREAFENHRANLRSVTAPRLVHGDFHFGNLLWSEGHLSGVVDFEWALAGDPLADFRNRSVLFDSAHGADALVIEEYARQSQIDLSSPRLTLYEMIYKLELLSVSAQHWLGKVSWAKAHHMQIEQGFSRALAKLNA